MGCSDPAITYLRHYGYSVVRLPKADLACLELLADAGGRELERFGRLDTVLVAGEKTPLPPVTADVQAASISGERSGELSVGVGLSVLGGVLAAMGGSKLGLDVSFKRATSVVFEFADVLEDRIEPAKLDQYLGEADLDPRSRQAERLLEADDLYVTTAVIKSRKFTIEAGASRSAGAELSVPEIQQVVGATVKVSGATEQTSKVTFEGAVPLVFGFKAVRLFYDRGRYTAFKPLDAGKGALRALPEVRDDGTEALRTSSPFARLGG